MINLTVISIKDIIKYLVKVTLVITILVAITRYFCNIKENNKQLNISVEFFKSCINQVIPGIDNKTKEREEKNQQLAIQSELSVISSTTSKTIENNQNTEQNTVQVAAESTEDLDELNKIENISTNVLTEVISSAYNNKYTNERNGVQIRNETSYELTEDILNPSIKVSKKNMIIFHTHTCESYTPSEKYTYQASGNYRSIDLNYTVSRVGDELEKYLKDFGYKVFHDKTFHDYPAYSGSYGRSLKTVQKLLEVNKDADIVLDIHRDAIGDNTYAPKVKIGEECAAQLMFVIGTNGSGLQHDNWQENLKFAVKVQEKANQMYPGLFKPIILRNSRYNQHLSKAACIIEVGATGNTMDECLVSMKYLSKVIDEVLKEQ